MTTSLTVGLVQMTGGVDVARNIDTAVGLVREAAGRGAAFVLTPEMTGLVDRRRDRLLANTTTEADDPTLAALRAVAADLGVWLLIGSLALKASADRDDRLVNRSFLIGPDGAIAARYDKVHLFDVDLPDGESYRESSLYDGGARAVVAETPWGGVGLSVCYDLRFASLYRALALAGARLLTVPSAFTRTTGEAHWHVLLRARAIETGAFVLAPAQVGRHEDGRQTFGHALAVDPWGRVLVDGGEAVGVHLAKLALDEVDRVRARIPSLDHGRSVTVQERATVEV